MNKRRRKLKKIKSLGLIGIILGLLTALGSYFVYKEADQRLIKLDSMKFGEKFVE